jgi:8-oxo-dGTP pyrophosphatase MutT (NUDIX family)
MPVEDWRQAPKVKAWEQGLRDAGCSLQSVDPLHLLRKPGGELLFALLQAAGKDPEGFPLLPYALLRGPACVVVPVCWNPATGEERFLIVRQRRIAHGALSLEFPAGMLDQGDDPAETALRELQEETGLQVPRTALIPLWGKALYSSPGLCDESIYFFSVAAEVEPDTWRALEGGNAGHAAEGEHIFTTLKTFAEAAPELSSVQTLLAFFLYFRRIGEMA